MLKDLLDENLIQLNVEASDWEDAVRKAAAPLVEHGKVTPAYVDDIVKGVKDLGPYIVLTKNVALPHARPESGALESAIGICILKTPVEFGSAENDPVKFLFPLSAKDSDSHLAALASLVEFLSDENFLAMLDKATSASEIVSYISEKEGTPNA